jgi:hypothetical protein
MRVCAQAWGKLNQIDGRPYRHDGDNFDKLPLFQSISLLPSFLVYAIDH